MNDIAFPIKNELFITINDCVIYIPIQKSFLKIPEYIHMYMQMLKIVSVA